MIGRILIGFIAAVISVLLVHQVIIMLLANSGFLPPTTRVYNMLPFAGAPTAITAAFKSLGLAGWPVLFNQLFWGGLWGVLFALVHPRIPGGLMLLKGLIFGLLIAIFSNWLVLPLIRGQAIFQGGDVFALARGALISGGFGAGLGLFYGLLRRGD